MSSALNSKVNFFFDAVTPTIRNRTGLKRFIVSIFKEEKRKLESVNYVFSNDKSVQQINRTYLDHSYSTDVITFELSEIEQAVIGEVYISVERVRENSSNYRTSFNNELHRVMFHGALHLCGYGDKSPSEIVEMRKKEMYYLTKYLG